MLCPFCSCEDIKVIDSRDVHDGRAIRRRRQCVKCDRRFTTYEEVEVLKVSIRKRNGNLEDYNREKMRSGLEKACEKRPIASEQIEKILSDIEYCIHSKHKDVVKSKDIGKMILQKLKSIDDVAYVRFASVYKSFGSVSSFQKELDKLLDSKK